MRKTSLENRLDELKEQSTDDGLAVAYRTSRTSDLEDGDRTVISEDEQDGLLVVIEQTLVLPREQAEREGYTILGPAENAAEDGTARLGPNHQREAGKLDQR